MLFRSLLYPTKDIAAEAVELPLLVAVATHLLPLDDVGSSAGTAATRTGPDAALLAAIASRHFNCNVSFVSPNDIFCLIDLEEDGKYLKVLTTTGELGWIIYDEDQGLWAKGSIEEVNQ